jgi:hypothetical protein
LLNCAAFAVLRGRRRRWPPGFLTPVGNVVGFLALYEIVHSNYKVILPSVALRERPIYVDGYPLNWNPDVVLIQQALTLGSQAMTGSTGIAV